MIFNDFVRLQATDDSLNVILKNTHFRDGLLTDNSHIRFKIEYEASLPVLILKFKEPIYDFFEILEYRLLTSPHKNWLNNDHIVFQLILADTVITDQLNSRFFQLSLDESEYFRNQLLRQRNIQNAELEERKMEVYSKFNFLLR